MITAKTLGSPRRDEDHAVTRARGRSPAGAAAGTQERHRTGTAQCEKVLLAVTQDGKKLDQQEGFACGLGGGGGVVEQSRIRSGAG
ncbi:hypothetical protein GCM10023334_046400 [Nonomuraea thailandensis]